MKTELIYSLTEHFEAHARQTNNGVAHARNTGFMEMSRKSEYVLFLDQDDLLEPDALYSLYRTLMAQRSAVAASGLSRLMNVNYFSLVTTIKIP